MEGTPTVDIPWFTNPGINTIRNPRVSGTKKRLKLHKLDFMCAICCHFTIHLPSIYHPFTDLFCVEEHPHDAVCERRELGQVSGF